MNSLMILWMDSGYGPSTKSFLFANSEWKNHHRNQYSDGNSI